MKKILLLSASVIAPAILYSASVKGKVVDATSAEPLIGVTWKTFLANDSIRPVAGGITDSDGTFSAEIANPGEYVIQFEYLGMKPEKRIIKISSPSDEAQVGSIALVNDAVSLDEVIVVGKKSIIESNGEKTAYNVTEDPGASNQSVLELLKKVPMVTVDGKDEIRINGNSDFKIYINGNPEPALSRNASTILKTMPASSFKKIEVITEPGAKYDAEGTGGILNLVTETISPASANGYLVTATAAGGNTRSTGAVNAQAKINKVSLTVNASYVNGKYNIQDAIMEMENNSPEGVLRTLSTVRQGIEMWNADLDFSWQPNSKNYFSISGSLFDLNSSLSLNSKSSFKSSSGASNSNFLQNGRIPMCYFDLSADASWKHFFRDDETLTLRYQINSGYGKIESTSKYTYIEPEQPTNFTTEYNHTPYTEHTAQVDYAKTFSEHHTLDLGAKGIFRRNHADSYTLSGLSENEQSIVTGSENDILQFQDIAAAYAEYGFTLNKFSAKAGFRYEFTRMGIDYLNDASKNFSTNFSNYVPNAALNWNFSPANAIRLSYQMRITRPGIQQVNPYSFELIPGNIQQGNPALTAERNNTITLTYSNFTPKIGGNIACSWSNSTNQISNFSYFEGNTNISTYANIGLYNQFTLRGFLTWTASRKLRISLNASLSYTNLKYEAAGLKNHGWTPQVGGNIDWELPLDIHFGAYGGWNGKNYNLQGYYTGFYYYGASLSRSFLKENKLKVSLSASNFLNPHLSMSSYAYSSESFKYQKNKVNVMQLSVSISYTFGNLKEKISKQTENIVNDDVQRTQNSGLGM